MVKQHKSSGFTLVELVSVIVIIGIIAVIAAPRFLNLQTDARIAAVEGASAALNDAAQLAYSKAAIDGVEQLDRSSPKEDHYSETNLGILELKYGYPEAYAEDGGVGIMDLVDLGALEAEEGDWDVCYVDNEDDECYSSGRGGNSQVRVGFGILDDPEKRCHVRYTEAEGFSNETSQRFAVVVETEDC